MFRPAKAIASILLALAVYAPARAADAPPARPADDAAVAAREMAQAADHFIAALSPEALAKASFDFDDQERVNWHFIPRPRKGLPIKEMTPAQRNLAHALLSSGLGNRGYAEAVTIMSLEQVLHDMEAGGTGPTRDAELYFFSLFGKPGAKDQWGWRVEGHHLSLNFTIVNGKAVGGAPAFFGTNPANIMDGPRKGLRVLAEEEDMGRQLATSMSDEEKETVMILKEAPKEMLTANNRKAQLDANAGLPVAKMTADQKGLLTSLIKIYAYRLRPELAAEDMKRIEAAGMDKIHFSWAGGLAAGAPHYYRIQGPTFMIEYDDTQNNANHIHTVWRDLERDFGDDLLLKHYQESHQEPAK